MCRQRDNSALADLVSVATSIAQELALPRWPGRFPRPCAEDPHRRSGPCPVHCSLRFAPGVDGVGDAPMLMGGPLHRQKSELDVLRLAGDATRLALERASPRHKDERAQSWSELRHKYETAHSLESSSGGADLVSI